MNKKVAGLTLVSVLAMGLPMASYAADLYQDNIKAWGKNVSAVEGREFKFLVDPAKTAPKMKDAFKDIYTQTKAVLEKNGLKVVEREKKAWSLSATVKTFFDTEDFDLYKKGYLIRTTTNYKKGYWDMPMRVVVKRIGVPFKTLMASKLATVDGKAAVAEDNIGLGPKGKLFSYVEKTAGVRVGRAELGDMNLNDFAAYFPDLKKAGLKAGTKLVAYAAWGTRCRPGFVEIPGLERPTAISMEAWARHEGGKPFVYDFSVGYSGDFKAMAKVHKATETAFQAVYNELNGKLGLANAERYVGSKVRVFLNQPR